MLVEMASFVPDALRSDPDDVGPSSVGIDMSCNSQSEEAADSDEEFSYELSCSLRHPGLCAARDAIIMPTIKAQI